MRYETKGGLFKPKPIPISKIYKVSTKSSRNFSVIISNFTTEPLLKELLFKFVNNLNFSMSAKVFEKQLNLLKPLTLDEQIRIINNTIENGWN